MKKVILLVLLSFLMLVNNVFGQEVETIGFEKILVKNSTPKLSFLWETDTLLTTVESVIYDEVSAYIYTSNIEGSPGKKDGKGSISKVALDGTIVKRDWIKDLNAPKGMDILNGILYVTDIDRLIEIDIKLGEIIKIHQVEGASFLNDVAVSPDRSVYFSDTDVNKIFKLNKGQLSLLMSFDSPNGLLVQGDDLLAVSWAKKTFNKINLKTKRIEQISDNIHNPDGIEAIGNRDYFVSSWNGMIHYISELGDRTLILDSSEQGVFAADIDYIQKDKILLVPTFFKNKVVAYNVIN